MFIEFVVVVVVVAAVKNTIITTFSTNLSLIAYSNNIVSRSHSPDSLALSLSLSPVDIAALMEYKK